MPPTGNSVAIMAPSPDDDDTLADQPLVPGDFGQAPI
jgi:hypothetical protein